MTRMNWNNTRYVGKQMELAFQPDNKIPGPHTNIKRAPVKIYSRSEMDVWVSNRLKISNDEAFLAA